LATSLFIPINRLVLKHTTKAVDESVYKAYAAEASPMKFFDIKLIKYM